MKFKIITLLGLSLVFSSCIKEIPYETEPSAPSINISGQFTDQFEDQVVIIREALSLDEESAVVGDPVEFADVSIIDNEGTVFGFSYLGKGKYISYTKGEVGKSYKLSVVTEDGREYESDFHEMIKGAEIEEIKTEFVVDGILNSNGSVTDQERINVSFTSRLHNGNAPIYTVYRVAGEFEFKEDDLRISPPLRTCYVTQNFDAGNVITLKGSDLPNNTIKEKFLYSTLYDYRFRLNFGVHVTQYAVDSTTYAYWNKLETLTSTDNSLFDPPPGRIKSNLRSKSNQNENVFGYFLVGGKTDKYTFTNATKIGNPVIDFCRSINWYQRPEQCIDCLFLANSTRTKPSYWPI